MASEELGLKGDGVEKRVVKKLDEAMGELLRHRKARMASGKKEKEALVVCLEVWKDNKLKSYNYDDRNYVLKESEKIVVEKDDED